MSSTPLFDQIQRRTDAPSTPTAAPAVPTSPVDAPTPVPTSAVPGALVAAIDAIPERIAAVAGEYRISDEQRAVVEALGDSFIRVIVDTLATELERIVAERTIRA